MSVREIQAVAFPVPQDNVVNMMPVIHGEPDSVPRSLHGYLGMMAVCDFVRGSTVYLTVHESHVSAGSTQRRPGVHVESPSAFAWGGGWGGQKLGLYMASNDGACRAWDCLRFDGDHHGAVPEPDSAPILMKPSTTYHMTDRTPHEALPSPRSGVRQFFRLVSPEIEGWWREHNTPNPLGVRPECPILEGSKFE